MKTSSTYRWQKVCSPSAAELKAFKSSLELPSKILQLLWQRGIHSYEEAKTFFKPDLDALHDPFKMRDMDRAVERISKAREQKEKILIYGDYDVDGTTAVAFLSSFLEKYHPNLDTYIPDRYKEGYGVSRQGIEYAAENGFSLIIALDCGIKAVEQVAYAQEQGIDFIICDHHTPGPKLPEAIAILDPKQKDCNYPYKGLSGCGVGFKLAQALCEAWQGNPQDYWERLDLLALSIGADIVPMDGENRVLAYHGLLKINEAPSLGLRALLEVAKVEKRKLTISDLVFILAPRINAAGRLDHGRKAVDLLNGKDLSSLPLIAAEIDQRNTERKELDRKICNEAIEMLAERGEENQFSTVVWAPHWHKGVIGIVASRLIENFYRPTVVLTKSGDKWAGSARSVAGFNLYKALEACSDHLIQFGGHPAAAGMTLKEEQLEGFASAFEQAVARQIKPEQRQAQILCDLELSAEEIDAQLYRLLQRFAPFGPDNMPPVLVCHHLVDAGSRVVGKEKEHLKVMLSDPENGICLEGIAFRMADKLSLLQNSPAVSVAFHLELNEFRGSVSLQLRILDLKESGLACAELKETSQ